MADPDDPHLTEDGWAAFRQAIADKARMAEPRADLMSRRLRRLAGITGVSATDVRILEVLLLYQTNPDIESLVDDVFMSGNRGANFNIRDSALTYFLDMSHRAVAMRFTPEAPLVRSDLVSVDDDGDLSLVDRLAWLANFPGRELGIRDILLGEPDRAELEWSDFEHVAESRDHVEKLLREALRAGEVGVNILLHGPSGTGTPDPLSRRGRENTYLHPATETSMCGFGYETNEEIEFVTSTPFRRKSSRAYNDIAGEVVRSGRGVALTPWSLCILSCTIQS